MPPPKTVSAAVYIDSSNKAVVFPPVLIAAKTDDVDIVNATGADIVVIYPGNVLDGGGGNANPNKSAAVVADKGKDTRKIAGNPNKGRHAFKVFSFATNAFAEGNSDPEFIIE